VACPPPVPCATQRAAILPCIHLQAGKKYKICIQKSLKRIGYRGAKNGEKAALPLCNLDVGEAGKGDMSKLDYLHEPAVIENLHRRFKCGLPYTHTGRTCIAINPYRWLELYDLPTQKKYRDSYANMPPHVYANSAQAYSALLRTRTDQSILVSGESGAGKTETVKILMHHLAMMASSHSPPAPAGSAAGGAGASTNPVNVLAQLHGGEAGGGVGVVKKGRRSSLTQGAIETGGINNPTILKVLESNPLLEAFGNAKTVRNDNSSRFGKFVRLQFKFSGKLVGSRCQTYLLEKSRVVGQVRARVRRRCLVAFAYMRSHSHTQAKGERNFHSQH
jgi:myosin-5